MDRKNLFSDIVSIGPRNYVLNIIVAPDENFYLIISENEPADGRLDHKRIRIPIEDARGLRDALNKSISKIDKINRMMFVSRSSILDKTRNESVIGDKPVKIENITKITNSNDSQLQESYFHRQRSIHPKAYKPWSAEDDSKLEDLYCEGCSVKVLSKIFERNIGAIRSRIDKLELCDKYG